MKKTFMSGFAIVFVLTSGCGASRVAGECQETSKQPCWTGKVCTHDPNKGCEMCYCDSPKDESRLIEDENAKGKNPLSPP